MDAADDTKYSIHCDTLLIFLLVLSALSYYRIYINSVNSAYFPRTRYFTHDYSHQIVFLGANLDCAVLISDINDLNNSQPAENDFAITADCENEPADMNGDYADMHSHMIQSVDYPSSQTNCKPVEYVNTSAHAKSFLRFTDVVLELNVVINADSLQIITI